MKKVKIEIIAEYEDDVTAENLLAIHNIADNVWPTARSLNLESNWCDSFMTKVSIL